MDPALLILKRASASLGRAERLQRSCQRRCCWPDYACDCRAGRSTVVWPLAYGYHHDRKPTHGYAATREAAMAAFAKSWRRK